MLLSGGPYFREWSNLNFAVNKFLRHLKSQFFSESMCPEPPRMLPQPVPYQHFFWLRHCSESSVQQVVTYVHLTEVFGTRIVTTILSYKPS